MFRSIPSLRVGRAALAAAVVVLSPGCDLRSGADPAPDPVTPPAEAPVAPAEAPVPSLDRQAMAIALEAAASTFAAGQTVSGTDPLIGRTFDIRLAFGCSGPTNAPGAPSPQGSAAADGAGLPRATWGSQRRTIELRFVPADWSASPLFSNGGPDTAWEAVEGVWIARPWLRSPGCPKAAGDPLRTGEAPTSPQTAGLAAVFESDGSRIGRRTDRAYTHIIRGEGETPAAVSPDGYRLRLAGRVVGFPGGRALRCDAAGPDQRPVCVAAVNLDTVAFESADGRVLSTWTSG